MAIFLAAAAIGFFNGPAFAQTPPSRDDGSIGVASAATLFDLGSRFLRHLGNEAAGGYSGAPLVNNPGGGGADSTTGPRYRTWFEGYGIGSKFDTQATFPGDRRTTWGGVAGIGMEVVPGVTLGLSVDQSRTKVNIISLPQSAVIDLTQVGGNAAFESGPWTLALSGVYGFANVDSRRTESGGVFVDTASYGANLWGGFAELSYLWTSGDWRIVPKGGFDGQRVETNAFTESGGPGTVSGTSQVSSRVRAFAGAEVGHTWFGNGIMFDLSGYGRAVDILWQDIGQLNVSGGGGPASLQGIAESRLGADAGAVATWRLSQATKIYLAYDGRFRSNFTSHAGTVGAEFRW